MYEIGCSNAHEPLILVLSLKKYWYLKNDNDLVGIFHDLQGSDFIFIWAGELSVEDDLLKAIRSL